MGKEWEGTSGPNRLKKIIYKIGIELKTQVRQTNLHKNGDQRQSLQGRNIYRAGFSHKLVVNIPFSWTPISPSSSPSPPVGEPIPPPNPFPTHDHLLHLHGSHARQYQFGCAHHDDMRDSFEESMGNFDRGALLENTAGSTSGDKVVGTGFGEAKNRGYSAGLNRLHVSIHLHLFQELPTSSQMNACPDSCRLAEY